MSVKKFGCFRKMLAVVFTSLVAPVVVNVATQEATTWRQAVEDTAAAGWKLPPVESTTPAPSAPTWANRPVPSSAETPVDKAFRQWRRFDAWGRWGR